MSVGEASASVIADVTGRANAAAVRWSAGARLDNVRQLTGGASSLTFLADLDEGTGRGRQVVLKVAPPGLEPVRNRDVLRQARLMRALDGQPGVRVPRVLFDDQGIPPDMPPLLVMEMVPGECVEPVLVSSQDRPAGQIVRSRSFDAATVLAALHQVIPGAVGLGDEPVVTLENEIDRWTQAFETVSEDLSGEYRKCAAALHATIPTGVEPVVNHGDYRLGNTLCQDERLTSIIDWEIWSVGDPRVDVTWFTFFTDEAAHPAAVPGSPAGTPTKAELIRAYEHASGVTLRDMAWFDALTKYKEAAATALLVKRGRKHGTMPRSMEGLAPALPRLVEQARDIVGR